MDILRLRYTGLYRASVPVLGRQVDQGDIIDVPGRLVTDEDGNPPADDAHTIEFGNPPEIRAFPHSTWEPVTGDEPSADPVATTDLTGTSGAFQAKRAGETGMTAPNNDTGE